MQWRQLGGGAGGHCFPQKIENWPFAPPSKKKVKKWRENNKKEKN